MSAGYILKKTEKSLPLNWYFNQKQFDREISKGMRLDIPSGTAVRFEPGQIKNVDLIPFSGERKIFGFNKKIMGKLK